MNTKHSSFVCKSNESSAVWQRDLPGSDQDEVGAMLTPDNLTPPITGSPCSPFRHVGVQMSTCDSVSVRIELPSDENINLGRSSGSMEGKDPRKDSGIRSRLSSIQDQIDTMKGMSPSDLLTERASGYYALHSNSTQDKTAGDQTLLSQSSFSPSPTSNIPNALARFRQLRKQSDLQLIRCVQQDTSHRQYQSLVPPLSPLTLFFVDPDLEAQYRLQAHRPRRDDPPTLASSLINTYLDILVSALVYCGVALSLFLLYPNSVWWLVLCLFSSGWHLFVLLLCLSRVVQEGQGESRTVPDGEAVPQAGWRRAMARCYPLVGRWGPWHSTGASLLCLPLFAVFSNFTCVSVREDLIGSGGARFFCYMAFVALIHLCNFTQLNWWMKSTLATIGGVVLLSLMVTPVCPCPVGYSNFKNYTYGNYTDNTYRNNSYTSVSETSSEGDYLLNHHFHHELLLVVALLLLLVWFLNREFEIGYRLSFHGSLVAMRDRARMQETKDQADFLLHNIIPRHVAESIKSTAKYSENHRDVAVLFGSIVNFNELYDESYLGGKEYLRVLNELVFDFDELLEKPEFANIDKIKTIGSTYMAASGLNPEVRRANVHPRQHIFELVEFAGEMQRVIDAFNQNLLEFNLILRIGLNFGDVTAGVIGTTKLYYDIWGDAVNIASRMDTTGVAGRIQVSEACAEVLKEKYCVEARGQVYVKGKDNMNVYLLKGPQTVISNGDCDA